MHTFQIAFYDFWQESSYLALLMVRKGQSLFFMSEKGQGAFFTPKKGQSAILTFKKKQGAFLTSKKRTECGALRKTLNMNTNNFIQSILYCCIILIYTDGGRG